MLKASGKAYLGHCQISRMESNIYYFYKKVPSQMFNWVLQLWQNNEILIYCKTLSSFDAISPVKHFSNDHINKPLLHVLGTRHEQQI